MATADALRIAAAVRQACVLAALEGYERAQIAGLCQEGAWEAAVDAMRMLDLTRLADPGPTEPASPPPSAASSA